MICNMFDKIKIQKWFLRETFLGKIEIFFGMKLRSLSNNNRSHIKHVDLNVFSQNRLQNLIAAAKRSATNLLHTGSSLISILASRDHFRKFFTFTLS